MFMIRTIKKPGYRNPDNVFDSKKRKIVVSERSQTTYPGANTDTTTIHHSFLVHNPRPFVVLLGFIIVLSNKNKENTISVKNSVK